MKTAESMIEVLAASVPNAALAGELQLFGQFVGSWDLEVVYHEASGSKRTLDGEWHFGWVLEGRAIQDVWIAPRRSSRRVVDGAPAGEYGATLRFYDPILKAWRSTWIGPVRGVVMPFVARAIGDEIVLEGSFAPGVATRWIFSQISADSFHWRAVESADGWKTHILKQEMQARRQRAQPEGDLHRSQELAGAR